MNLPSSPVRGSVLIVGPDGAGKTTIVEALTRSLAGTAVTHAHFRPGILFRGNGDGSPVTEPHAQPPRGTAASVAKLALVLTDFALAHHGPWRKATRNGVLLLERGWFDQAVDPVRYRLPRRLTRIVQLLGRSLPKADLAVVLSGDPDTIVGRKPELDAIEVKQQLEAWRAIAPRAARRVVELDTVRQMPDQVAAAIMRELSDRTRWRRARLAPRRLDLRATEGAGAIPALSIYRPAKRRARAAARVNKTLHGRGIAARSTPPIDGLHDLLTTVGISADGIATMRSPQPERHVLGVAHGGRLHTVIKIGRRQDPDLRNEAAMLGRLQGGSIPVPDLRWCGEWRDHFVLATEAIPNDGRTPDLELDDVLDIAIALANEGIVHGDFAPWNFVGGEGSLTLLDWESSHTDFVPLHDLTHFVVQNGALLGRYDPAHAARLLTAPRSPGWRYLDAIGVDPATATEHARRSMQGPQHDFARTTLELLG